MTVNERYSLWLNFALKADFRAQIKLYRIFDSAEEIFKASQSGDIKAFYDDARVGQLTDNANEAYIDKCLHYLEKNDIKTVTIESKEYPTLLKNIDDPPYVLYYKGNLKKDIELPISVIGSRRHSAYAKNVAGEMSKQLCENGVCIISGMALGIDAIASNAALETNSDYPTVVVLGCGVDVIYPLENERLYHKIVERGAVVSEYLPGTKTEKWHFPYRNRIMSGLSKGIVVVEAREKSGTSITVSRALEQGRDVFAVPGRITDNFAKGSNAMIREGFAKPVFSVADILEEYSISVKSKSESKKTIDENALSLEELLIIKLLQTGEKSIDELAVLTKYEIYKLNSVLTELEFSGIIKQLPGRLYEIVPELDF